MTKKSFEVLILIGRPASGKSEIIDYLQKIPLDERRNKFHLANLDILDDFPILWSWFEEDHLLSEHLGQPRLYTDDQGYLLNQYFWHLLVERLGLEFRKRQRDPHYHAQTTTLVEFSRGREHGGYQAALSHLPEDLLQRAGVIYINVSFAEALRKNRRRFNPERPDSSLEHGLPDEKMKRLYEEDDWKQLTSPDSEFLHVGDIHLPYVVFENEDDVTTNQPKQLADRLENVLNRLWVVYASNKETLG